MYRLIFQSGRNNGARVMVRQAVTVLGQAPQCHLILDDDDGVALQHARLEEKPDGVYITPLTEEHAVQVNGGDIAAEQLLRHGDTFTVGRTTIQYQEIIAPSSKAMRPYGGVLQPFTWLLIFGLLIMEVLLFVFFAQWEKHLLKPAIEQADLAYAEQMRIQLQEDEKGTSAQTEESSSVVSLPGAGVLEAEAPRPESREGVAEDTETKSGNGVDAPAPPSAVPVEILEALSEADFTPVDTNTVLFELSEVVIPDPIVEEAQRLLAEASTAVQFADHAKATKALNHIYSIAPDFIPAYMEHAQLLEVRGDLEAARDRWTKILELTEEESIDYQKAMDKLEALQQRQTLKKNIQKTSKPTVAGLPQQIKISGPSIRKMPADSDIAEMRVLNATLELAADAAAVRNENLQLFVTFYDRVGEGDPVPTRAITTPSPIHFTAPFTRSSVLTFDATYIVPRGLRATERRETGQQSSYYGYTLHVFAGQVLQDAFARPKRLLDLPIYMPDADDE